MPEFIKEHRHVTQWYTVVDGPVMETSPFRLSANRFKVDRISITWTDGEVSRVFMRGQAVLADGRKGKLFHDRTLTASELPDWMDEFLDIGNADIE